MLAVELATIGSTIDGGDAGELAAAACVRAVAHAPGYPLWTLLGKVALLIPSESPAWRLSLASALCTAGAAALLMLLLCRSGVPRGAAALGAAVFAFAGCVWRYAVTPEVFALSAFLVAAGAYAAACDWCFATGLALGLGLANQMTSAALLGPLALWVCVAHRRQPKSILAVAGGAVVGLLPYLYLPWASAGDSVYSWGDQTTVSGLMDHLLRSEYGTFQLMQGEQLGSWLANLGAYGAFLVKSGYGLPALLTLCGLVAVVRGARALKVPVVLIAAAAVYVVLFHVAANLSLNLATHRDVLARFWIMPQLVVGLLVAFGFAAVTTPLARRSPRGVTALALVLAALFAAAGFRANDRRHDDVVDRYARAAFAAMPQGTLALVRGDLSFPLVYLQACEGVRPDVLLVNRPFLQFPWSRARYLRAFPDLRLPEGLYDPDGGSLPGTYGLAPVLELNIDRHPIMLHHFDAMLLEYQQVASWAGHFEVLPLGVLMRAVRAGPHDWLGYMMASHDALAAFRVPTGGLDAWDDLVAQERIDAAYLRGAYLSVEAEANPAVAPLALNALAEAAVVPGQTMGRIWKARGFVYAKVAEKDPTVAKQAVAAWKEYLKDAPAADAGRDAIEAAVKRLAQ